MTNHDAYLELCAAKALGCLDAEDAARLERHLAGGCAECEAALAEYADTVVDLAASAPPARPRPLLRDEVLEAASRPARPGAAAWGWAAAACFALVAAILWLRGADPELPDVVVLESSAGIAGAVVYRDGAYRFDLRNARAPAGKDYELWALRGEPVSLGVIEAFPDGRATFVLHLSESTEDLEGFAISLEPEGGARGGPPTDVVATGLLP